MDTKLKAQKLDKIVWDGVKHGASVIHLEPFERGGLIKYRIGNWLGMTHQLQEADLNELTSELKKLAKIKSSSSAKPQNASFDLTLDKKSVEAEVSIVPIMGGEKIVMHLSSKDGSADNLENLGFWGEGLSDIRHNLAGNYGLILVSGHHRDGISDTLDSLANLLNNPIAKIARIKPGGRTDLEKALDDDPSIIAIDRLDDKRTAILAAESALKRRMILAGVYADGAIDALGHLRSLGVEPFVLASVTRLSISQRRLRRLCQSCTERYELSADQRAVLDKKFGLNPALHRKIYELERSAQKSGMGTPPLNSTSSRITHLWRPSKKGCNKCSNGYVSHTAAVEVLPINDRIQQLLADDKTSVGRELQEIAEQEAFIPMTLDGLVKSLRGQTTIDEVLRA